MNHITHLPFFVAIFHLGFGSLVPVSASDVVTNPPPPSSFWKLLDRSAIEHQFPSEKPMVLCMQGRKVVVQVEASQVNGVVYKTRFFDVTEKIQNQYKVWFDGGGIYTPKITVQDRSNWQRVVDSARFDGTLRFTYKPYRGAVLSQTIYPSMDKAVLIEEWKIQNISKNPITVEVAKEQSVRKVADLFEVSWQCSEVKLKKLAAGEVVEFSSYASAKANLDADLSVDIKAERSARDSLVKASWSGAGRLETPEPLLDAAYALQKLHVLECPVDTYKGVIAHNGSLTYSPGIWANDPVEYSSPLFPFFGDPILNESSMNMYRIWSDYCKEHGIDPFPGSFEGESLKLAQRDRGDNAMVLYGLCKFLLFQGDRKAAEELWPLVEFCDASIQKHMTKEGIVASKTDEMEGRYPTGDANLSTAALAYGGYRLAATMARALGKPEASQLDQRADGLRKSIDSYFGATVEGFNTYRYYEGNTTLRGWILLPLAMGITERQETTVEALTSDKLWPGRLNGADILAESTRETEWGRETYYALRVLYLAGRTELATDLMKRVVTAQVFGPRGPYPDEDAIDMLCPGSLYPRVFTEGVFGIVPTGFDSFECAPYLPTSWPSMALKDVRAFGKSWDLLVDRDGDQQRVTITSGGKVILKESGPAGRKYKVKF